MKTYKIHILLYLFVTCLFLASCSSDDDTETLDPIIYLNTKQGDSQVAVNINYKRLKESSDLNYILLPVKATGRVNQETKIILETDESLVKSYNDTKGTEYEILPSSAYSIDKNSVSIASGGNISTDSLQIVFNKKFIEEHFTGFVNTTFILPIKISSVQTGDKNVKVSTNLNVVYTIVDFSLTGFVSEVSVKPGTSIDRSVWTSESRHGYSYGPAKNSYDSDLSTSWVIQSSNTSHGIYYDMGKAHKVKGVSLVSSYILYEYYNCVLAGFSIGVSTDGANWTDLGSVEPVIKNNEKVDAIYQFAEPLEARYVRILPNKFLNSNNLASIAEIYFYE
jgi:hypothetical protein